MLNLSVKRTKANDVQVMGIRIDFPMLTLKTSPLIMDGLEKFSLILRRFLRQRNYLQPAR